MFLLNFKNEGIHKVVVIFGFKIKIKLKRLQQKQELNQQKQELNQQKQELNQQKQELNQQKEREEYYKHYYISITDSIKNVIMQKVAEGKKIIIYGKHEFARRFQYTLNLNIAYCVDDNIDICSKQARNVYDLAYEVSGSFFVVVIQPDYHKPKICTVMTGLGLVRGIDYDIVLESSPFPISPLRDVNLGFSRCYNEYDNRFPGFKIFGSGNEKSRRIVTLGGSTTDPTFMGIAAWPECLYNILIAEGLEEEFCIFNGGMASYTSSNELLKLARDVITLKPDFVISYSGINDFTYYLRQYSAAPRYKRPFIHFDQEKLFEFVSLQYGEAVLYGLQTDRDSAKFWADNQRMMHAISEEFGIKYIGILQANTHSEGEVSQIIGMEETFSRGFGDEFNKNLHYNYKNLKPIYDRAEKNIEDLPYLLNFRHIFDDFNDYDIYYDECHAYERGNEVIAANVYENLLKKGYI
jgi:hypothetical protein